MACREPVPDKPEYPLFDFLGANAPAFSEYFDSHVAMIRDVQATLSQALNDDPEIMDRQIRDVESRLGTLRSVLGWADSLLDVAEHKALSAMPPRSPDWTDMDRQAALAAAVNRERRFRNIIRGLVESIDTRISYGQSRLRHIERSGG